MSKVRVGIIGAGRWGPNLIRNFNTDAGSVVMAVADTSIARLNIIKDKYPDVKVTESAHEVLTSPQIDAIVISTPTATHYDLTKEALKNNKHVFVEKPLATKVEECEELVELAKNTNKVLFVGHIFVYNAGIQTVKKYIQSGELGNIHYIHATRTNLGPIRTDVNSLWDLATHDVSIFNFWFDSEPTKVSALGGGFLNSQIEDVVFATYTYPKNILANIHVSWLNPKKVREIVVVGEKKMLVWDDMDIQNPIRLYDKKVVVDKPDDAVADTFVAFRSSIYEGDTTIPKIQLNEPLSAECSSFLKAIKNPSTSLSTGKEGTQVVKAILAANASLKERGKEIHL
ncbi:MAG: Gfo/Idh/MocA family oxidoreductase [Oligoflexia bacterium]|nr:Gfo/Idh/MocA family oxidoreductase [Oligoflexia bacterium]